MQDLSSLGLIVQNLYRKPYRTLLVGLCVALATGLLFTLTLILRGVQISLQTGQARLGADLVVVPEGYEVSAQEAFITGQSSTFYMPRDLETRIAGVSGVRHTSVQVYAQTLTNAACCTGEFFLVGFDPLSDFTISPWLAAFHKSSTLGPQEVIVGDRILLGEGEGVSFYGTTFTVEGVLEKTGMGIDRTIYIPLDGLRAMIETSQVRAEKALEISPGQISAVMVQVAPGIEAGEVAEAIEGQVRGVQAFTTSQLNQAVHRQLSGVLQMVVGITFALWLMSLLVVGLIFSVVVNERQRELGLLRAMGAQRGFIFRLVMAEAGLLTGLGGLSGCTLSLVFLLSFSRLIQKALHIPYLTPSTVEISALITVLLVLACAGGGLASLLPAIHSSRMGIYDAIRQGE
jgi:putative ABC transport system permease protein